VIPEQSQGCAVHLDCQEMSLLKSAILTALLVLRRSANSGKSGEKPLVRQKVESAGKIAQYRLVARAAINANCQVTDFKRTFPIPHGNRDARCSLSLCWTT
jgi:hypothetical protein